MTEGDTKKTLSSIPAPSRLSNSAERNHESVIGQLNWGRPTRPWRWREGPNRGGVLLAERQEPQLGRDLTEWTPSGQASAWLHSGDQMRSKAWNTRLGAGFTDRRTGDTAGSESTIDSKLRDFCGNGCWTMCPSADVVRTRQGTRGRGTPRD